MVLSSEGPCHAIVVCRGLHKNYQGKQVTTHALRGIDLEIPSHRLIAITGASGSGKSTLLNLIALLDTPTQGSVSIDGQDTSTLDDRERTSLRSRKIGMVFQQFNLIESYTALENVSIPLLYQGKTLEEVRPLAMQVIDRLGMLRKASHFPGELSGGEMQRIAIARALITQPKLVLADEPTGNLDSRNARNIIHVFKELGTMGISTVVVSHDATVVRCCEAHIHLQDGHIAPNDS